MMLIHVEFANNFCSYQLERGGPKYEHIAEETKDKYVGIFKKLSDPVINRYVREFFRLGIEHLKQAGCTEDEATKQFDEVLRVMKNDDPCFAEVNIRLMP